MYCTVLYCSIDVLGCDCCKKLCVKKKSGEKGYEKEKSVEESDKPGYKEKKGKWLEKDPNIGEERVPYAVSGKWSFLQLGEDLRKMPWAKALTTAKLEDVDAVPVLFYASRKNGEYFYYDMPGNAHACSNVFAFNKNSTFDDILKYLQTNDKIKNIVLSCEGDNGDILYDGTQNDVAEMKIVDKFTAFKNAKDPFLKRVVCLSFTYDVVSTTGV